MKAYKVSGFNDKDGFYEPRIKHLGYRKNLKKVAELTGISYSTIHYHMNRKNKESHVFNETYIVEKIEIL